MMNEIRISTEYIAGFFDGEGSIGIKRTNRESGISSYTLQVQVCQVNPVVLFYLKEKYGGSVQVHQNNERSRPAHHWTIWADKALAFIQEIQPHLLIKYEQAALAVEFMRIRKEIPIHKHLPKLRRGYGLSKRRSCYEQMKILNRRGIQKQDG